MHVLGNKAGYFDILSLKKAIEARLEEHDKLSRTMYRTKTVMRILKEYYKL